MNLANKITILRILLIPFFIACLIYYSETRVYLRYIALAVFTLAILTDALDGGIARGFSQITELGVMLDPIADKILITSAFISLSVINSIPEYVRIPAWVVIVVISRDVFIILGTLVIYFIKGNIAVKPSWLGKFTTFTQMLAIWVILISFRYNEFFMYPAIFFTLLSGMDYIWRGSKQLNGSH